MVLDYLVYYNVIQHVSAWFEMIYYGTKVRLEVILIVVMCSTEQLVARSEVQYDTEQFNAI